MTVDERAVLMAFFEAEQAMDIDGVLACWCDDGIMRTPYAPHPIPRERRGRDALSRMFTELFAGASGIDLSDVSLVSTEEPGLWLARWSFAIHLRSGPVYRGSDIGTFRVRSSLIAEYTEYFDPVACARSYGIPLR